MTRALAIVLFLAFGCAVTVARAQEVAGCGVLTNHYGPFDYRLPKNKRDWLPVVEHAHFTPQVEELKSGQSAPLINDIDYTLRAFPNHARALSSVARFALQGGKFKDDIAISSAECAFARAIAYAPDDPAVRIIFGNYLYKRKRLDQAREQYEEALKLYPDSADINYNAGLFYTEIGDLEHAKACANIAYDAGYPLPGLSNRIAALEAKAPQKSKKN
jgi:tetratricopeptide (TPR) repeat protein